MNSEVLDVDASRGTDEMDLLDSDFYSVGITLGDEDEWDGFDDIDGPL